MASLVQLHSIKNRNIWVKGIKQKKRSNRSWVQIAAFGRLPKKIIPDICNMTEKVIIKMED